MIKIISIKLTFIFCFILINPVKISADTSLTNKQPKKSAKKAPSKTGKKGKEILIKGQIINSKKENMLLKQLKKDYHKSTKKRRFEIVFFISLPVTLWLTYTLMLYMKETTTDANNPNKKLQNPHYIYILSTSFLTSFYIAYKDSKKYVPPPKTAFISERKIEIPVMGIKF